MSNTLLTSLSTDRIREPGSFVAHLCSSVCLKLSEFQKEVAVTLFFRIAHKRMTDINMSRRSTKYKN